MACDPQLLLAFIQTAGLSYRQNNRSYIFDCPRCGGSKKLWMLKQSGHFQCYSCGEGLDGFSGRAEYALSELASLPLREVRRALYDADLPVDTTGALGLGISDLFADDDFVDLDEVEIPSMEWPHNYYPIDHPFSERGLAYLAGRGIGLDVAKRYGLRYAPETLRVVFPVELGERLVGWQERLVIPSRTWDPESERFRDAAKILSSDGIPSAHVVMFANRLQGCKHAVVCEGPVDAIKADLCGGNVATMGKGVGAGQVRALRATGIERVYLALDPDAAKETARLVREFSDLETYVMRPPGQYKDFGEMDYDQVLQAFRSAERVGPGRMFLALGRR